MSEENLEPEVSPLAQARDQAPELPSDVPPTAPATRERNGRKPVNVVTEAKAKGAAIRGAKPAIEGVHPDKLLATELNPVAPAVTDGRKVVGWRVTVHSKIRKHRIKLPHLDHVSAFVQGADGKPKFQTTLNADAVAEFKPVGNLPIGAYVTTDPQAIAFFEDLTDGRSARYNENIKIFRREPIFSLDEE